MLADAAMSFFRRVGLLLVGTCFAVTVGRNFDKFQKYLQDEKGYRFSTVRAIENNEQHGMLVATKAFDENFLIARMPSESVFSEETVNLTLSGYGCDDETALDGLDSRTRLVMCVLQERDKPETEWELMFANYPENPTIPPSFWSELDMNLLRGSGLLHELLKERQIYEREYDKLTKKCPPFTERYPAAEFLKGGAFVGRNGIGSESLLPFLDMANHDNNPNAEIGHVQEDGIIAMVSTRQIRAGEEITISYNSGKDDRADLTLFVLRGFVPEKPLPLAKIIFPSCVPPSIAATSKAEGEADLPLCCENEADDESCFGYHVRAPEIEKTLQFGIQRPLGNKKHTDVADLSEILQRIRSFLADSGVVPPTCQAKSLDLHRPLDMASEREVMRIFHALLSAHLSESSWVLSAGEKAPATAGEATEEHKSLAVTVHGIERPVLEWFVEFTEYADRFLQYSDPDKLQFELCAALLDKTSKAKMSEFSWLVERVLAPLAFAPKFENGEACSVEDAVYKMKAKECKELRKNYDEL